MMRSAIAVLGPSALAVAALGRLSSPLAALPALCLISALSYSFVCVLCVYSALVVLAGSGLLQRRAVSTVRPVLAQMPKGVVEPEREMGRGMLQGGNEIGLG